MASSKRDKTSTDRNKSADDYNFYRVYSKDGTPVPVNQLFNPTDSHLGCFAAKDIGPPHLALNVKRFLCKLEKIPTSTSTALYKDIYSLEPLGDRDRVDLSRSEGRKSKALIVKFLDAGSENVKEPDKPAGVAPGPTPVSVPTPAPAPARKIPATVPVPPAPAPAPAPRTPSRPPSSLCGQTYYITNAYHSDRCLNVADNNINADPSGESEYLVLAPPLHRGPKQRWTVEDAGNGEVYLRNGMGRGYSFTNDGGLGLATRRGRDDKWELQQQGSYFRIMATGTRLLVASEVIYGNASVSTFSAIIVTSQPSSAPEQLWSFSKVN